MSDIDCVYTQSGDQFATQMWCDERDCWLDDGDAVCGKANIYVI